MARSGSEWSDEELLASIRAYRRLFATKQRGEPLEKASVVNELTKLIGRSKSSVEMRMQNISAVLDEQGRDWIDGYKPLRHYPARLKELIELAWLKSAREP
jgi:5-methylcytosine-specific restriction protein A